MDAVVKAFLIRQPNKTAVKGCFDVSVVKSCFNREECDVAFYKVHGVVQDHCIVRTDRSYAQLHAVNAGQLLRIATIMNIMKTVLLKLPTGAFLVLPDGTQASGEL